MLGGQYGDITVALQYQFRAWSMHITGKYRDLVFGIGAEEMGHVEMLAVMIAQLLEKAPLGVTEDAVQDDPTVAVIVGGTDVQQAIVAGAGARPVDSNGNPWMGSYLTASGNLLADFQANANADFQARDLLAFLLARDTMHQNQWLAASAELMAEGVEALPVPSNFPLGKEERDVSYQYINFSDGAAAAEGRWASGPTPDGHGESRTSPSRSPAFRCLLRRTPTRGSTAPPRCRTSSRRRRAASRTP